LEPIESAYDPEWRYLRRLDFCSPHEPRDAPKAAPPGDMREWLGDPAYRGAPATGI
jgi:hypothetical protein